MDTTGLVTSTKAYLSIRIGRQKIGVQNVPGIHFPILIFAGLPCPGGNIGSAKRRGGYGRLGRRNRGGSFQRFNNWSGRYDLDQWQA